MCHQVTEGPVVTALVGPPRKRELGFPQVKELLYLLLVLREIVDRFLCDGSQAYEEFNHVTPFILKHLVQLQGALVLVVGTGGLLLALLGTEHNTAAVLSQRYR